MPASRTPPYTTCYHVGDVVRVVNKEDAPEGARKVWVDPMDRTIGITGVVVYVNEGYPHVRLPAGDSWTYLDECITMEWDPERIESVKSILERAQIYG